MSLRKDIFVRNGVGIVDQRATLRAEEKVAQKTKDVGLGEGRDGWRSRRTVDGAEPEGRPRRRPGRHKEEGTATAHAQLSRRIRCTSMQFHRHEKQLTPSKYELTPASMNSHIKTGEFIPQIKRKQHFFVGEKESGISFVI